MDNQENNQTNNTQANAPVATGQNENQAPETHPMGIPTGNPVSTPPAGNLASNPPIAAPAESVNPTPPADPPPSEGLAQASEEKLDGNAPVKKDNKLMLLIIGAVLVLVILFIVMVFSGSLNKSDKPAVPTPQAQQIVTPTPSEQAQEAASQEPIANQQDVTNTLGELDKTNPDAAGADLNQNDQDASTFSQ